MRRLSFLFLEDAIAKPGATSGGRGRRTNVIPAGSLRRPTVIAAGEGEALGDPRGLAHMCISKTG